MSDLKKLYLVDASSVFFRAYYAIPIMHTKMNGKNLHTNALYGYITTTLKILDKFQPNHLVYCFDRPEPSHRVSYYKEYKANRDEMPEDLEEQIPHIHTVTDLLGIPRIDKKRYEADDLIGSLAIWAKNNKTDVMIISSDKDFAQLVHPQISLYDPMKEIMYDSKKVYNKWGIQPEQMIDYLAIVGDASDNVPGARGIGPKGAQKLLNEYSNIEEIYKNLKNIPDRQAEKLQESKKNVLMSKRLVKIVTDLSIISHIDETKKLDMNSEKLKKFLEDMQFKSIHRKLFINDTKSKNKNQKSQSKNSTSLKKTTVNLTELQKTINPYEEIGIVILKNQVHLYTKKKKWIHLNQPSFTQLGKILSHKKIKWWGYNLKDMWKQCKVETPIGSWDMMVAHHLITGEVSRSFSSVCEYHLSTLFTEEDAISYLLDLRALLTDKMKEMDLLETFENIEIPLIPVLYRMEEKGILLDAKKLKEIGKTLNYELGKLEEKIFKLAGHPFNIASPQQLNHVLFEELKLKKGRKTKTGYSTDSHVLHDLVQDHPIAQHLLEYRELFKLKTTYIEGLLNEVHPKTSRIHTSFNQTMTATGRLSSVKPNLQNIPIRTERGRHIRACFVASKNHVLIGADYSQIELRILAHFSKDPVLVQAFFKDEDIHHTTAAELFDISPNKVSEEQRRLAKTVNFGILYGQTAFGLSQTLNISRVEAQETVDRYFKKFPKVRSYINASIREAEKKGYAETLFGRKRFIPEISSKNKSIKKLGERLVINTRIQGTASEIVKKAMIQLDASIWSTMLVQIHDELLFECRKSQAQEEISEIKKIMEETILLDVPLKVHIGMHTNWNQAHGKK